MSDLAEVDSLLRVLIGLFVLAVVGGFGFGFGILSRMRRIEAELTPTAREMRAFLRGVRAVRRVRAVRNAQQQHGQRPQ